MPYPKQIVTMAQNLLDEQEDNPGLYEIRSYMLWNAILNYHFPADLDYGVVHQTSATGNGTKPDFLVVRVFLESEHVVVVAGLNNSGGETQDAMDAVVKDLVDYVEDRFTETRYPAIYGIVGIGLWWTALRIDKTGLNQSPTLVPWYDNAVSNKSFLFLKTIADEVRAMTQV